MSLGMNANTINKSLSEFLKSPDRPNNHEHRDYLGMSQIGNCPYQTYNDVVNPQPANHRLNWYNWSGYLHEDGIREALEFSGVSLLPKDDPHHSLVAPFDGRYRGHVDFITDDWTVIDVKTVNTYKYKSMRAGGYIPMYNYAQIQAYLDHGGFEHGVLVYLCRDLPYRLWEDTSEPWVNDSMSNGFVPAFWAVDIFPDESYQDLLNRKAELILEAIDNKEPPTHLRNDEAWKEVYVL